MEINLSHFGNREKLTEDMKTKHFYDYLPQRYADTNPGIGQVRNFIYKFKDGDKMAAKYAAKLVATLLWRWYSYKCSDYVIVCTPCSSMSEYRKRFSYFSAVVADRCMQDNAMSHVHIYGKRDALHRSSGHVVRDADGYCVTLDEDFFRGRKVIIFDDLITTGVTADNFAEQLKAVGADVRGGLFLAQTVKGIVKDTYLGQFAEHTMQLIKLMDSIKTNDCRTAVSAICAAHK